MCSSYALNSAAPEPIGMIFFSFFFFTSFSINWEAGESAENCHPLLRWLFFLLTLTFEINFKCYAGLLLQEVESITSFSWTLLLHLRRDLCSEDGMSLAKYSAIMCHCSRGRAAVTNRCLRIIKKRHGSVRINSITVHVEPRNWRNLRRGISQLKNRYNIIVS